MLSWISFYNHLWLKKRLCVKTLESETPCKWLYWHGNSISVPIEQPPGWRPNNKLWGFLSIIHKPQPHQKCEQDKLMLMVYLLRSLKGLLGCIKGRFGYIYWIWTKWQKTKTCAFLPNDNLLWTLDCWL